MKRKDPTAKVYWSARDEVRSGEQRSDRWDGMISDTKGNDKIQSREKRRRGETRREMRRGEEEEEEEDERRVHLNLNMPQFT